MSSIAITRFQWPALQTYKLRKNENLSTYKTLFRDWQKVIKQKLDAIPNDSLIRKILYGQADNFHRLWAAKNILDNVQATFDQGKTDQFSCYFVRDLKGEIQGIAMTQEDKDSIELEALMTSPKNIDNENGVKGVGKKLLKRIANEHLKAMSTKPIKVSPTDEVIPFYEKLGFEEALTVYDIKYLNLPATKVQTLYERCSAPSSNTKQLKA